MGFSHYPLLITHYRLISMKIKRIEPVAVSLPMVKPVKMSFEEVRSANNALMRIETDDGVADPLADAERTRRICDVLGNGDMLICADANQGWSVEQAIAYVRAVEDTALEFFEQPVAGDDLEGMAAVARASRIKIGADEGVHSIEDLRRHHEAGAACGASLKAIKLGGIKPVYEAARLCEQLGMKVNLACKMAESGIATAALLHLAAAVPSVDWGVSLTSQYLTQDILKRPLAFADGHAEVPAGPGLGIEVDEAKVRRYAREA